LGNLGKVVHDGVKEELQRQERGAINSLPDWTSQLVDKDDQKEKW